MQNIVLTVHLILALILIGTVLLQRSEGGGLSAQANSTSSRAPQTALGKVTWGLAAAFIATSVTLTILAARDASTSSVVDQVATEAPAEGAAEPATLPDTNNGAALLPPTTDAPAQPPKAEE